MNKNDLRQILSKAISEWGIDAQTNLAVEEMGELIVDINHHRRGRVGIEAVQEEIADVMIAMKQLAMIYGELGVDKFIEQKTQRMKQRLDLIQEYKL